MRQYGWNIWRVIGVLLLVKSGVFLGQPCSAPRFVTRFHTWHILVADDDHLEAGGPMSRAALFCFFVLCETCGVLHFTSPCTLVRTLDTGSRIFGFHPSVQLRGGTRQGHEPWYEATAKEAGRPSWSHGSLVMRFKLTS